MSSLRVSVHLAVPILVLVLFAPCQALDNLDAPRDYRSARVSSYDRTGGNADGGQMNPIKMGETRVLADIEGPGRIVHIWMTTDPGLILRMYWDGEENPSVEAPIAEFFGLGHGEAYSYESGPLVVANNSAFNCFFPMPFRKSAKITVENVGERDINACYYYIDYQIPNKPIQDALYFHASYRQEKPVLSRGNYVILDAVGRGHYAGCFMYVRQNRSGWFGEGDDMIYIDGSRSPTLHGTGAEDYFCHAWGFAERESTRYFGVPFSKDQSKEGGLYSVYRFHVGDAIAFEKSVDVTIEHGHANSRSDDYATVAYWYQTEPHKQFPPLAPPQERTPSSVRAERFLDEGKLDEYRELQTRIRDRSNSGEMRAIAQVNLLTLDVKERGKDAALRSLMEYLGPFPLKNLSDRLVEAIKDLGGDPDNLGKGDVYLVHGIADGLASTVTIDGSLCCRTEKDGASPYIYFDVDDSILRDGDKTVLVEVEYCDAGEPGDSFLIQYDSAFDAEAIYHESKPFAKPGMKGWQKAVIQLDRARFAGRQNSDADFRLVCGDDDLYVRKVRVRVKEG